MTELLLKLTADDLTGLANSMSEGEARNRFGSVFAQLRQASGDMRHVTGTAHGTCHGAEVASLRLRGGGR